MKPVSLARFSAVVCLLAALICTTVRAETVFRARIQTDPVSLDWNVTPLILDGQVIMTIMEGLFEFDDQMNLVPALAKSWKVSPDGLTYVFELKPGVKWSDGKPLVASDFVDSWERLLNPLTPSRYKNFLFNIVGADDYNAAKLTDFGKVGAHALDDKTLEVKLRTPVAFFPQMLSMWFTFPVRKDLIRKYGNDWSKPDHLVVLGPFQPSAYQHGVQLTVKRNPSYHGAKPAVDTIVFQVVDQDTTALTLFRAGKLDFLDGVSLLELGELATSPAYHSLAILKTCYLGFYVERFPVSVLKMRRALAEAIDRSQVAKAIHQDVEAAAGFVPPSLLADSRGAAPGMNVAEARKLFNEVIGSMPSPKLELIAQNTDDQALLSQYIQGQFKANLGIDLELHLYDQANFRVQRELKVAPMYLGCWTADYADADSYFGLLRTSSPLNHTGWKNRGFDALVTKAAAATDAAAHAKIAGDAAEILVNELPLIPLYYAHSSYLLNPRFSGLAPNRLGRSLFRQLEIKQP